MCMWFWRASCGVCVSQLIGLARASWALGDFGCHSGPLLPGFLGRAVVVLGFMESFSKFYRWHSTLVEKYKVSLKILLQRGKSEPEFCGDMEVCGFGGIMGWGGVGWGGVGVWGLAFQSNLEGWLAVMEELAVAWMLYDGLCSWLSAWSLLVAVLWFLVAQRRFGPRARGQPLCGTLTSGLGLGCVPLVWPAMVQLLVFTYSGTQLCWLWG